MDAVVAAVMRSERALSGGAVARAVDDMGDGCDGAPRPFGCYAVMITCARTSGHFSSVGPVCQRRTRSPAVNACGACGSQERGSPRSINCERGRGESLTSPLRIRRPVSCLPFLAVRFLGFAPARFVLAPPSSLLSILAHDGSAADNRSVRAPTLDSVDGDTICSERASEW
jgi:hypothetical protein